MTREEVIENLKILKEDYWDDDGYGHETKQYDDTMLALDMAIKALEQQEPILDKIRDKIEQLPTSVCSEIYRMSINADEFKENVLAIIDEYKAESEE